MSNKPRKKKHSRTARDQRLCSWTRMWMWESEPAGEDDFVLHVQRKAMMFGWCDLTSQRVIDNIIERPRNWVVCGRALVRNPAGKMWMEQADFTVPSCKLLEIRDAYTRLREAVMSANQTRHVFDCGWIAQTWTNDDPAEADPEWVYHDTPEELIFNKRKTPPGEPYSIERYQRWQKQNEEKYGQVPAL